jgi:spore maturation protein SpmA
MVLNLIWVFFFVSAFLVALYELTQGNVEVFPALMKSTFDNAKLAFELSLFLTGTMAFWLGLMRIAQAAGLIETLSGWVSPLFSRLFPELPPKHPAMAAMMMNFAANMLGLDNAATPLGLKAMNALQECNTEKERATNAQIMFLTLNTSGLTLVPINVMLFRSEMGAADPTDVFIPILIATFIATLAGIAAVSWFQKINLFQPVILLYLGGLSLAMSLLVWGILQVPKANLSVLMSNVTNVFLFGIILFFIAFASLRRLNAYEHFIEGAKEAFEIAIKIVPYLVAILVAIGVFRTSGAMDWLLGAIKQGVLLVSDQTALVDALPVAFMKPLSGSGARGLMVEAMKTHGADSVAGRLACLFQGSTETTFYVLAVYFGSVGVRKMRHAVFCGLFADLVGMIAAIAMLYLFF